MREAINAAAVVAGIDAVLLLKMTRDGRIILDDFTVIVGDPDAAVRAVRKVHGVAPRVGAGGEFRFLLAGCATNCQRRTIRFDHRAVDEISRRLADEVLPAQSWQRAILIHHRPAGGGKPAVGFALRRAVTRVVVFEIGRVIGALLPPRMRLGNRVGATIAGSAFERRRGRIRIARQITPRQRRDEDSGNSRRDGEAVAGLRHREAERVRRAGHRLDRAAVRADAEVGAGQRHGFAQMRPGDFTAAPAASEINPAVRAPLRGVDAALEFARWKAGEEDIARLGFPVAIAVGEEHDVRRARDNEAAAGGHETVNRRQVGCPHIGRVHATVAVQVAQQFHHAERAGFGGEFEFLIGLHPAHLRVELSRLVEFLDVELAREIVSVQFGDKHSPAFIPAHRRGRRDERLTGDDLHAKTIRQPERRGALFGRHGPGRVGGVRNLGEGDTGGQKGQRHSRECVEAK